MANADLGSPLTASTAGRSSAFSGCGSTAGHTYKFFFVLSPGESITIGQTSNIFDSEHSVFWSESANPASYPAAGGGSCIEYSSYRTQAVSRTNAGSAPRKLWFVVNGYDTIDYGNFTLQWTITGGDPALSSSPHAPAYYP